MGEAKRKRQEEDKDKIGTSQGQLMFFRVIKKFSVVVMVGGPCPFL